MIQTIIVILLAIGSLTYLITHFYGIAKRKKQSGCEKCGLNTK